MSELDQQTQQIQQTEYSSDDSEKNVSNLMVELKSFDIIAFHYPCQDGLSSAFVAHLYHLQNNLPKPQFYAMQYGKEIDIEKYVGKKVVFCDWSPPLSFLDQLEKVASQIVILDHHVTARDVLKDKSYAIFDMNRSGVGITWDYFFPNKQIPRYLAMIQDRDLWKWQMEQSKAFTNGLFTICSTVDTYDFDELFNIFMELYSSPDKIEYYINIGSLMQKVTEKKVQKIAEGAIKRIDKYLDYNVCIVNSTADFTSELGNVISSKDEVDFAVIWSYNHVADEYYVSLRSCGDIDVSIIAKSFFGGGHKNSSGCTLKIHPCVAFVNKDKN
jgi:oligoribonuclease NrnB/cAMP/cGMP phosphodiesterase (DHH superfamily)